MERRKITAFKSSPLPKDYLKMVCEVFTNHFDQGLLAFNKIRPNSQFEATGAVYSDEIILGVSLVTEGQLSATTIYGSCDFDSKASSPGVEEILAACVDAIGSLFGLLLSPESPEKLEQLASDTLSTLQDDVPFEWTGVDSNKRKVFLRIDKSNPLVDAMADSWLAKHDPESQKAQFEEEKETENLFVTGPKKPQIH